MSAAVPVWIDCDPGHDDAFALLLAATHPELRLLGASTVHGNSSVQHVTSNAKAILRLLKHDHIPVVSGAAQAYGKHKEGGQRFHGENGLAGVTLLPRETEPSLETQVSDAADGLDGSAHRAAKEIHRAILAEPLNSAWIVAIGPLTNIACLVHTYPKVIAHIKGISIMGGAVGNNYAVSDGKHRKRWLGKDGDEAEGLKVVDFPSQWAEFNTWGDPDAAAQVFGNAQLAEKITMISVDLTYQVLATEDIFEQLFGGTQDEKSLVNRVFEQILEHSRRSYGGYYTHLPGPPLHDPLAVAVLLEGLEDGLRFEDDGRRWKVRVITEGEKVGGMLVEEAKGGKEVRIPRDVDKTAFWKMLNEALKRAEMNLLSSTHTKPWSSAFSRVSRKESVEFHQARHS